MLFRVIGPAGSGKTELLYTELQNAYRNGKRCIWISPEQQSVQVEREILARLGDGCNLTVEILNFERLPERIAREYGNLAVTYPDKGALCALLSVLMQEHKKELNEYAACAEDGEFASGLLGLFSKLRSERITPEKLQKAVDDGCFAGTHLENKVRDIALLFSAYDAYFDETRRDERDALSILADGLAEKPFFAGKTVFVDGYYTFTGQEYALLSEMMKQADAVYCSFTYDDREIFDGNRACAYRMARCANGVKDIPVGEYKRSGSDELRFLEQYLWSAETPAFTGRTGDVSLIEAEHAFGESEAVAREILRLVRGGMRYRDITVLARNVQNYAGVLDAVLEQNGIPFFFSEKEELQSRPLAAFLLASLELVKTDFSLSSVRKYLKSGYAGLTAEDADILLRYAESWNIRGKEWYGTASDWTRNPDGYTDRPMDEEQTANLIAVNIARKTVLPGLIALRNACKRQNMTGRDYLRALYTHLNAVHAAEIYTEKLNAAYARGEIAGAEQDSGLWELLMDIFDRLDEICGDKKMTLPRMHALLKLTMGQYSLGTIPPLQDCVTVGEAALNRPDNAKAVILMGCNDGVFPATVGKDPLFDDEEAGMLELAEIPVVEGRASRMNAERFYFYSAVTAPREKLIITYPISTWSGEELRPSPAVQRIRMLFPHLRPVLYTGKGEQALFSAKNAAAVFYTLPEGGERDELKRLLSEQGISVPPAQTPIAQYESHIRYRADSLSLSPSKIELYRACPFSYFGNAVMKLKEKKKNRFANQESGTFLHSILEQFLRNHITEGRFVPPASHAELERETDELAERYFTAVAGGLAGKSKRFFHLYHNLRKTLLLLLGNLSAEFAHSDFVPAGFEVGLGMKDSRLPAVEYTLSDGKKVYLIGSIDRVDTYEKDGVTYVRVVDYKSYSKQLDLDAVREYGLDEQMLLYLFAYCRVNARDGEVFMPAGVLYNPAKLTFAELQGEGNDEALQAERESKLRRTGILLQDEEIVLAMDRSASGRFLPVGFDKNGLLKKSRSLLTAEEFEELRDLVETQLQELGAHIFAGEMDVRPIKTGKHDACRYCKLQSACRYCGEGEETDETE